MKVKRHEKMWLTKNISSKRENTISSCRVPISGQSRESLQDNFEKEKEHHGPLISINQVVDRTAAAFSRNKNTVVTIGKVKI